MCQIVHARKFHLEAQDKYNANPTVENWNKYLEACNRLEAAMNVPNEAEDCLSFMTEGMTGFLEKFGRVPA